MEDNTLKAVIEAEKEIQDRVEAEKRRAEQWLEQKKPQIQQDLKSQLEKLLEANEQIKTRIRADAEEQASEIISKAQTRAAELSRITPERLQQVVRRRLSCILPRAEHDR